MPQTFKINLLNGGSPIHFGFFQAQPEIAHDQGNADSIWTNVWFQQTCASGGQITVLLEEQFYSWAGTVSEPAAVGVIVTGGKSLPAKIGIGANKGSTFNVDVQKGIIDIVPTADSAGAGAFEIDTGSFIAADNVLIGMSKPDPGNPGFFAPTAMINASGNLKYSISPKNNFFIAAFDTAQGTIFDYQAVSKDAGAISFSDNPGKDVANVKYSKTGTWSVTYANSAPEAKL